VTQAGAVPDRNAFSLVSLDLAGARVREQQDVHQAA
jgi:hypothetical protein